MRRGTGPSRAAAGRPVHRWVTAGLAGMPATAAGMSAVAVLAAGPTVCPVALVTGTACPGCGLTRAVLAMARGDLAAAWTAHPLAGVVVALAIALGAWWAAARWSSVRPPSARVTAALLSALTVALVAVWSVRLATDTLPVV